MKDKSCVLMFWFLGFFVGEEDQQTGQTSLDEVKTII
jgi:hypothetical protein